MKNLHIPKKHSKKDLARQQSRQRCLIPEAKKQTACQQIVNPRHEDLLKIEPVHRSIAIGQEELYSILCWDVRRDEEGDRHAGYYLIGGQWRRSEVTQVEKAKPRDLDELLELLEQIASAAEGGAA